MRRSHWAFGPMSQTTACNESFTPKNPQVIHDGGAAEANCPGQLFDGLLATRPQNLENMPSRLSQPERRGFHVFHVSAEKSLTGPT